MEILALLVKEIAEPAKMEALQFAQAVFLLILFLLEAAFNVSLLVKRVHQVVKMCASLALSLFHKMQILMESALDVIRIFV